MKCKRNIPCPMGGMNCCLGCPHKKCTEKCGKRFQCWLKLYLPSLKWGIIIAMLIVLMLILFRLNDLEAEHNAIIDRLDQVENTITKQIDELFPAEEFTDTEENHGGEFKSWMSFQADIG